MPAANWPKLENKRNTAGINVEDAREGNTLVHEELFAAHITLHLNRLSHFSTPPTLKVFPLYAYLCTYIPWHCLKQKIFIGHLSYVSSSPLPLLLPLLKVDDFRKRNSSRAELSNGWDFCNLRNIALSGKFAGNHFLSSNRPRSGHRR